MTESIDRQEVAGQLMHLQGLLRRHLWQHRRRREPWADPHQGQGRVLALLRLTPEITQKDLGFLLDVSKQSLGELLDKLQQRGFIEREPSKQDRRVTNVKLTDEGRAAAETVAAPEPDDDRLGFLECLDGEELAQFSGLLGRIIAHLATELGGDGSDERREMLAGFWRGHGGGPHGGFGFGPGRGASWS
ncbi:MAG: MarR family transcriptional regulator [Bifidobacteriaceae bacterium]|jgi:DNA-binding MarR family transcriptional regulator|nr:MarR family transcriptional regulator [Bifidobacteriaceae bacterium]